MIPMEAIRPMLEEFGQSIGESWSRVRLVPSHEDNGIYFEQFNFKSHYYIF